MNRYVSRHQLTWFQRKKIQVLEILQFVLTILGILIGLLSPFWLTYVFVRIIRFAWGS